jgi:hypothetical protein
MVLIDFRLGGRLESVSCGGRDKKCVIWVKNLL